MEVKKKTLLAFFYDKQVQELGKDSPSQEGGGIEGEGDTE